jgi:hypothetical protein
MIAPESALRLGGAGALDVNGLDRYGWAARGGEAAATATGAVSP